MLMPVKKSQPRKFESTTRTNVMADAINSLGQLFNTGSGQDQQMAMETLIMKRTGAISSQAGRFNGKTMQEVVYAKGAATGDVAAADFGTVNTADNVILWQVDSVTDYVVGRYLGIDSASGKRIYGVFGGSGNTDSPKVLSGSGITADTNSWDRSTDKKPVQVQVATREAWDSASDILYGFYRTWTFDSVWKLATISAETRYTIDTPSACS
jgi:hypothetical protein